MGNCLNKSRRQVQPSCTVEAKASVKSGKRKSKKIFNYRKCTARVGVLTDERKNTETISTDDAVTIEDLSDQHVSESVLVSFCSHSNLHEVKDNNEDIPKLQASQRDSPFFASNESIYEEFTENDGEIEEDICEEEDEDTEYSESAGNFVDTVKDENELFINLSTGKVNLDINEVEKAIRRLYSLRKKKTTPSQEISAEADEGSHDIDNTGNNENADVTFDDKCVLDNLPDNSKIADAAETPSQVENELTPILNDEIKQEETVRKFDKRTEDTNYHENGYSDPVCLPKSKSINSAALSLVGHKESDNDLKSMEKATSENNVLYKKSKENNKFKDEKTKSLISLITKESLEKVKNHKSRSDCGFSLYVSSPEETEPLRLIQIHATNKQVQDGSAKSFIKLIRKAATKSQFFDPFPEDKKKSRGNNQACSNLVDRNAGVHWAEKQGPSTNVSLTRVPEFHEAPPKAKNVRESLGLEKLRSYGIIPQCKEIERIKIDEDQFPGILPQKVQKKWNQKKKEKKCIY